MNFICNNKSLKKEGGGGEGKEQSEQAAKLRNNKQGQQGSSRTVGTAISMQRKIPWQKAAAAAEAKLKPLEAGGHCNQL